MHTIDAHRPTIFSSSLTIDNFINFLTVLTTWHLQAFTVDLCEKWYVGSIIIFQRLWDKGVCGGVSRERHVVEVEYLSLF